MPSTMTDFAPSDCDIIMDVDRYTSRLCLIGVVLVILLGSALIFIGIEAQSSELMKEGGEALCATALVPLKGWFDRAQRIRLLMRIKTTLLEGKPLTGGTIVFLRSVLPGEKS